METTSEQKLRMKISRIFFSKIPREIFVTEDSDSPDVAAMVIGCERLPKKSLTNCSVLETTTNCSVPETTTKTYGAREKRIPHFLLNISFYY
jgi:hypothetical protein